jgi:hypothetical protein
VIEIREKALTGRDSVLASPLPMVKAFAVMGAASRHTNRKTTFSPDRLMVVLPIYVYIWQ